MAFQTSLSPSPAPRPPPPSSTFSSPLISTILHPPRPTSDSILRTRTSSRKMRSPSMGSSRNRRAHSVTASATGNSDFSMEDYTFDLAKLGRKFGRSFGEKESEVITPERKRDEVGSEDDGPADFTINLGKWMRGTEGWRKDLKKMKDEGLEEKRQGGKKEMVPEEQDDSGEDGGDEDALSEVENEQGRENGVVGKGEFVPLSASTPAGLRTRADRPECQDNKSIGEGEALEMPQSPQLSVEERQDRAAEEVFEQISALQVEVERMRLEAVNHQAEKHALEHQYDELAGDYDHMQAEMENQRSSKEHLERVLREEREANIKAKATVQEKDGPVTPGSNVGSLRARFEPKAPDLSSSKSDSDLGKLTANARIQSLEAELKVSQEEALKHGEDAEALRDAATSATNNVLTECEAVKKSAAATISALKKGLQASQDEVAARKEQAETDYDTHRREMNKIRNELESSKLEVSNQQRSGELQEQTHVAAIEDFNKQIRAARTSTTSISALKNELEHAQEQLAETRRIVDTVEEENDRLTQTNARQAQDIKDAKAQYDSLSNDLESKAKELTEALATIESLKTNLNSTRAEEAAPSSDATSLDLALETQRQSHQQAIIDLKKEHESSLASLKAKILRAGEGMHKREERLAKAHQEEITSLQQRLTELESQKPSPKSPPPSPRKTNTAEIDELRNAILSLSRIVESTQSSLSTTQATLAETQSSLTTARQELESAQQDSKNVADANLAVNAELEAKFKTTIEKRETEWRRRVELLLKERDKMAKALMVGWGREEMGVVEGTKGRGQGFRYRFVDRE